VTIILESISGPRYNAAMKIALNCYSEHCKMVILRKYRLTIRWPRHFLANVKYWWIGSVSVQATDKAVECVLSVYTIVQIAVVLDLPSSQILAMV